MSPLNHKNVAECKTEVLYHAWKGQLFIQDQQVCDIVLQSPSSISIPAQLPAKLEIQHAVGVSELRKKLPEAAFRRKNYSDQQVRYQETLFCLYKVEILNQNELKAEQLIESLKEKKLALVKYLNDQGALILLPSSSFVNEKDAALDEPSCLQALFLISSAGPQCSTAKDQKCEHRDNERSLQVTLVLPGLRHALLEAAKHPDRGPPRGAWVKRQMREFAKRCKNLHSVSDHLDSLPVSFDIFSKKSDLDTLSEKFPQNSFAHLQFYLLHPQNYSLEMSAAVASLDPSSQSPSCRSNAQDPDSSSGLNVDPLPPEASEPSTRPRRAVQLNLHSKNAAAKTSQASDRPLQRWKRKSSRLLGASTRKMWSPMKPVNILEKSKTRRLSKKRKKSPSPSSSNTPEPPEDSNQLTLQLKNLQYPLRRKRGAEVLSAEFVQGARCESPVKATSPSESLAVMGKKQRLLRPRKDEEKAKTEDQVETRRPITRQSTQRSMSENALEAQKEASEKSDLESEKTTIQDSESLEKKDKCDSHALNMLADLALADSPMSSDGSQASSTGIPLQECCHPQDGKILPKTSDHEYHRAMKKLKSASLSGKVSQYSLLSSGKGDLSPELPSSSQERTCTNSRQKGNKKPGSAKSQAVLPGEAADILDPNIHTHDISAEHSYASSALDSSKKGVPHSPDLKNGVKYVKSGPLLPPGKVLPFRHQLTVCHQQKQLKNNVQIMTGRLKEDFSKSHKVTLRDRTVKVTFQWEPDYLFTLDSKYTNNSLEKTVVRAVHGPWDVSLSDGIEEMKLILHMWVALFHSKLFKSPTVRTVVEHSNPAKYVSLNRIIDPLELVDNSEGAYSLEKCPADSISEATQISSRVEERAISLSDKPLSCNELSSTNCIEDELQPTNPKEPNDLLPKREVLQTIASSCEDAVPPLVEVADGKHEGEFRLNPGIPVETLHGNALGESSDDSAKHWKLRADAKTESSEAVNLSEISQSDATPVNTKLPDNSGKQHVKNTAASASAESRETSSASLAEERGESHRIGGVELLRTSETAWLEASAQEDGGLHCEEVIKSQDLPMDEEDGNEESVEWESIDLALSDSNDTDEESRDVDLDQEGTEEIGMVEEGETGRMGGMALPAESLLFPVITSATVSEYQIDLPNTKDDSVVSPANSTSLHQKNLVEGFCLLQEDIAQDRMDSVPPQASSVQDEKVELSTTEDTAISASQMDVGENSFISWENKGIKSAYSASTHDSELLQAEKDLATQGELERKALFPNPDDLTDISCDSMEEKDLSQSNSVSLQATLDAAVEFLGDQEVSTEPTKHHIFLNRMDLIEDISQDDIHLADSVAFQTSEGCQVQNSLLTQREATGNQDRSLLLVQNLAPAKEMVLIQGSCVPQKEEGTPLVSTAQFPDGPVHQTSHETTDLVRNQEDSSTSARTTALPEPMDLAENTCISQEKKACHLADTVPLKANEAIQIQQSTDILEKQNTRQRFKADNWKFHLNSEDQKCCVKNENIGATSAIRDVTSDEKINQISLTISEDVKSVLCELIDAVSARSEESEETCAQETSSLNGISSSTLEYVTPLDSEEENTTTDQFARTDQRWMVNENLEQCRIFAHQDTATSQEQEVCHSALHENMRYDQMNTFEKRTPQENEPASSALDALPSSSCIDWPTTNTTSLLYKSPSVSLANPRDDNSIASVLCETEVGQTSHRASMSEGQDQLSEAFAKARDLCCTRTFHSSHRHESFTGGLGLINSLNKTWSGPTQSTLDMECLRFYYRVKEVLRKPQPPTSSAKELSLPVKGEALPLRKVPEMPLLNPPLKSRSPLLITIVNPGPRHGILHEYPRRSRYSDTFEPPPLTSSQESLARAARYRNHGQDPVVPFHLNKLNYKNKLKDSQGDISVIMDEFAELSRVMTLDDRPSNQGREPNTTSEDAPENRVPSLPRRTASYEHLFTELWSTVHTRLKNVVQEACKKTYAFYLMETDDDPFFGRVKNLLKKAGHTETEPLLFCKANHLETERLMVIIRNEDIFPHIHKIPCLLRLKRFPNVTFAGVDSPEDILEHTYQELFQGGGFVVSDDKVLEMMTIGELKEMVKTLETLNGHGRWRWLLHYKEVKKLREDARENSAAHAKESLLKSCQGANITEALHYHQCDSKAVLRSEHLNCLLNLQVQHISQRFAVFITEKLSTNREALENKGILALDVNTFLTTAEDIAAPFRSSSSYW